MWHLHSKKISPFILHLSIFPSLLKSINCTGHWKFPRDNALYLKTFCSFHTGFMDIVFYCWNLSYVDGRVLVPTERRNYGPRVWWPADKSPGLNTHSSDNQPTQQSPLGIRVATFSLMLEIHGLLCAVPEVETTGLRASFLARLATFSIYRVVLL